MEKFGEKTVTAVLLYTVARKMNDYRVLAASFVYSELNQIIPKPEEIKEIEKNINVQVRFSKNTECWEAVFWRARTLAFSILDNMQKVVVAIIPPKDSELREKLRYEIEGARIKRGRKVLRAGGLIKKLKMV